ncbi:MAG: ROK family protein [Planctomycetes bacterium]|nr:ROK family protein [Planctomycetota bacterium]
MNKILVIDVGGTNLKLLATGHTEPLKIPSGHAMTGPRMIETVLEATKDWQYETVSIGYPGPVVDGKPLRDPWNLGPGWVDLDLEKAFKKPVKVINDAAMQALGSYEGGRMLFLGLGTGLGSTLILDHTIAPMELAHLPYKKKRTFEDYVGQRGLDRLGKKKWRKAVDEVVGILKAAVVADYVVLGGGNSRNLDTLPKDARLGSNDNAFKGGFRLWEKHKVV